MREPFGSKERFPYERVKFLLHISHPHHAILAKGQFDSSLDGYMVEGARPHP